MGHFTATIITKMNDAEKELAEADKKCKSVEAAEAKAKSRAKAIEAAEAEMAQLKNKWNEIEVALALKKKERLEAQAKGLKITDYKRFSLAAD